MSAGDNPYAVRPQPAPPPAPESLALARALMRHRVFAVMHLSVAAMLLVVLGTIVRSGGASPETAWVLILLSLLTLGLLLAAFSALRARPLSIILGAFADLLAMCTCILTLPALWSLILRFQPSLHQALDQPPPLRSWSPHWPTVILLPAITLLNVGVPLALALFAAV